jgi:phosphomevalonate kinase
MIAVAPGKLFTTGAYAILEGGPAVVLAVDRHARADGSRIDRDPRPEVAAVARLAGVAPPVVDTSALEDGGRKLGLGSSAAGAVAAAAIALSLDPRDQSARRRIFDLAWRAHREVQPRGSGGDVAAATWGGMVIVRRRAEDLDVERVDPPASLVVRAFALDRSTRTSDVLERLAARAQATAAARTAIVEAAEAGARAIAAADVDAFLAASAAHVAGLAGLGAALDLALVPPEIAQARDLLGDDAVLLPSGAGGGDCVLWLSRRLPTEGERASLSAIGLAALELSIDPHGVHVEPPSASRS